MLFAHLKRILKLDRLRLRGLTGARDEFLLAATAQNLRRMGKWLMPKLQAIAGLEIEAGTPASLQSDQDGDLDRHRPTPRRKPSSSTE